MSVAHSFKQSRVMTLCAMVAILSAVAPMSTAHAGQGPVSPAEAAIHTELFPSDPVLFFPQDPTVTTFDDTYGYVRSEGRRHEGNDLMAPKMTPVYAVADGVVTIMRKNPRSGYWIALEHAGNSESWYMHLNNDEPGTDNGRASIEQTYAAGLQVGDFVTAGQLIGYVGDSGNAEWTGSHTHFELRLDGRLVDPYDLLYEAAEIARQVADAERISALISIVD